MCNLLITGAQGFIGKHAIKQAHQREHTVVVQFDWHDRPDLENLKLFENIQAIMHFGAVSSTTETDVELVMQRNYDFSVNLIDLANKLGIPFQWSSSASIYGLGCDFREQAAPDPRTPYAWSKYLFERYVANNHWSIPIQGFRYFNVYGDRGEEHKGAQASPYHKFKQQALETGIITVFEHSDQYIRDFVHVDSVLDTQFQFLNIPESGIWNIGSGQPKSFLQVAQEIADKYQANIEYIPMPCNLMNSYQKYTCANLNKLNDTLALYCTSS